MISLPRSLVIDRLCTGCIGTRWIQYSRSHEGATKHISLWKIEVNGKCKKALKREEKQVLPRCVLSFFFSLLTKQHQKVDDESQRNLRKYALICAPVFSTLLSLHVVCSHRLWRGPWAHSQGPDEETHSQARENQTTEAGVQEPSSLHNRG